MRLYHADNARARASYTKADLGKGPRAPPLFLPLTQRFCVKNRFFRFNSIFRNVDVTLLCITNTPTTMYAACPEK